MSAAGLMKNVSNHRTQERRGNLPNAHITRRRRNTHEASDDSFACPNHTKPALRPDAIDKHPPKRSHTGSGIRIKRSIHPAHRGIQRGPTIKPKPPKPNQHRPQKNQRSIMRPHMPRLTLQLPLPEHKRIRQRRPPRRNVHGPATGVVEGGQVVEPAVGVPGPAGDGAVDDCRPQEPENEGGHDAAAFEGAADDELDGDGAEEELVQAEDDFGDVG